MSVWVHQDNLFACSKLSFYHDLPCKTLTVHEVWILVHPTFGSRARIQSFVACLHSRVLRPEPLVGISLALTPGFRATLTYLTSTASTRGETMARTRSGLVMEQRSRTCSLGSAWSRLLRRVSWGLVWPRMRSRFSGSGRSPIRRWSN